MVHPLVLIRGTDEARQQAILPLNTVFVGNRPDWELKRFGETEDRDRDKFLSLVLLVKRRLL